MKRGSGGRGWWPIELSPAPRLHVVCISPLCFFCFYTNSWQDTGLKTISINKARYSPSLWASQSFSGTILTSKNWLWSVSKKLHFWHHFLKVRSPSNIFEMSLKMLSFTTKVIVYWKNRRRGASLQGCGGRGSPPVASYGCLLTLLFPYSWFLLLRSVCSSNSWMRSVGFLTYKKGVWG